MRKFLIALAIVAQPTFAENYLVSYTPDSHAKLIMEQNIGLPKGFKLSEANYWGMVDDNNPDVTKYLEYAETIVTMSDAERNRLTAKCGTIDASCVQDILGEEGHD